MSAARSWKIDTCSAPALCRALCRLGDVTPLSNWLIRLALSPACSASSRSVHSCSSRRIRRGLPPMPSVSVPPRLLLTRLCLLG